MCIYIYIYTHYTKPTYIIYICIARGCPIRPHMTQVGPIWGLRCPRLDSSGTMWHHRRTYMPIWSNMAPYGHTCANMTNMAPCGYNLCTCGIMPMWHQVAHLDPNGRHGPCGTMLSQVVGHLLWRKSMYCVLGVWCVCFQYAGRINAVTSYGMGVSNHSGRGPQ